MHNSKKICPPPVSWYAITASVGEQYWNIYVLYAYYEYECIYRYARVAGKRGRGREKKKRINYNKRQDYYPFCAPLSPPRGRNRCAVARAIHSRPIY